MQNEHNENETALPGEGEVNPATAASINRQSITREYDRLPVWAKKEYQALVSILRCPSKLDETACDLCPESFFGTGPRMIAPFILDYLVDHSEPPGLDLIRKHLTTFHVDKDVEGFIRLLDQAPTFCSYHVAQDIVWFAHERRFWRRLTEAFQELDEQDFRWNDCLKYLLHAGDIDALARNSCFTRLLATICKSLLAPFSESLPPAPWIRMLETAGTVDSLLPRMLHKIALQQISVWEEDAVSFVQDENLGLLEEGNLEGEKVAIEELRKLGLARTRKFVEVNGEREWEEVRLTSAAWQHLLPGENSDT